MGEYTNACFFFCSFAFFQAHFYKSPKWLGVGISRVVLVSFLKLVAVFHRTVSIIIEQIMLL